MVIKKFYRNYMSNNLFKDVDVATYRRIKQQHGDNYIRAYQEVLAEINGLTNTSLYSKLKHFEDLVETNYLVAVMDSKFNCIHVGYTKSPFAYWINLLKNKSYGAIKDIIILENNLDDRIALRKAREEKQRLSHLTRKIKISVALELD
ncbi:hypothetical protein FVR03_20170 [Pontibacter qinzhouensis]|uniref:Uncharacterized protein n=1 Tax=Pontibacter qinzhouensis TaxID=2603253 RepID=A0A5C8J4H1_9BACT|nr:hypothetical protein [Pontibacter qinzhouensis]TXK30859.1 hypothetical protein FVR03_20170 [Pontibacter qinzhouensis]